MSNHDSLKSKNRVTKRPTETLSDYSKVSSVNEEHDHSFDLLDEAPELGQKLSNCVTPIKLGSGAGVSRNPAIEFSSASSSYHSQASMMSHEVKSSSIDVYT